MTDDSIRQQATEALAKQVVSEVSPAELPLFDLTAARYHADPAGTLDTKGSSDEALGFGVDTAVVLLAPFALDLVKRIITRIADKVGDSAADSLAGRIAHAFDGKKDDPPAGPTTEQAPDAAADKGPAPLTPEQLALVDQTAREEAHQLKLPPDRADALANGVVAALATRT
jgi:hypothetical protein